MHDLAQVENGSGIIYLIENVRIRSDSFLGPLSRLFTAVNGRLANAFSRLSSIFRIALFVNDSLSMSMWKNVE